MPKIKFNVLTEGYEIEGCEAEASMIVGNLATQIAKQLNYDTVDKESNEPIIYSFKLDDHDLDNSFSLQDCKVKNGDRLVLIGGVSEKGAPDVGGLMQKSSPGQISVKIMITFDQTQITKSFPENATVAGVIETLLRDQNYSRNNNLGETFDYVLASKTAGKEFTDPGKTLKDYKVLNGHNLLLNRNVTAGAKPHSATRRGKIS